MNEDEIIEQAKKDYLDISADYYLNKDMSKHSDTLDKRIAELNEWINTRPVDLISTIYYFQVVEICYRFYFLRDQFIRP